MRRVSLCFVALVLGTWFCQSYELWAEASVLAVHVMDGMRRPVRGLQIGVAGDGGSAITGSDGKARITLAKDTKPNSWVSLQILKSPRGKDFVMVSPWDYRVMVPSFENESANFVEVVVIRRGNRAALERGDVVAAVTKKVNAAVVPKAEETEGSEEGPEAILARIAKLYGLTPKEVDAAIRKWGANATDPYNVGLVALYEQNYSEASAKLEESLQLREKGLGTDQKAVAETACFLGRSLSLEGKYVDGAKAYQRCLELRPGDTTVMSNLGLSLVLAGDLAQADDMFQKAFATDKESGPDNPFIASDLRNRASIFLREGKYDEAKLLLNQSLAIEDNFAALNNLAVIVNEEGDSASAEQLWERALSIEEKLAPESPEAAQILSSLALLKVQKKDYAGAEELFKRAFAIREKTPDRDHPAFALLMDSYALLLMDKTDYVGAERYFRSALAIYDKWYGPNGPGAQKIRQHLDDLNRMPFQHPQN